MRRLAAAAATSAEVEQREARRVPTYNVAGMQLQLTSDELEVLRDLLSRELGNVKEEVYRTDSPEYKRLVKVREASILSLLAKLQDNTARA
jgi:hypothetical protein